jgi:hypothetical protein
VPLTTSIATWALRESGEPENPPVASINGDAQGGEQDLKRCNCNVKTPTTCQ